MINLKDFLVKDSKYDTSAFQQAIDLGSKRGGETVFVPFGTYTLSSVILKDNTNIVFEDGVMIHSAEKISDFNADEPLDEVRYQDLSHSSYTCAMFYADNVKNVSIRGLATIDMHSLWDDDNKRAKDGYYRGVKVFALRKVEGLRLYDLKIMHATDIGVLMGACKDVIISRLFINSHIDGISPDGCQDVVISDCIIKTGDDALVLKTSYFDRQKHNCERITIANCILSSLANAIKLGTESYGDFKYINVTNCVVVNTWHSGIAIESVDGANIQAVNISNITMQNVANPLFIYLGERLRAPKGTKIGSISDVNISNVYADVHGDKYPIINSWCPTSGEPFDLHYFTNPSHTSVIMSCDKDNPLKNISLTNVKFKVLGGGKKDIEVKFPTKNEYPESTKFSLPCYGLYVENVDGIKLDNVKIEPISPDEREEIIVK